MMYYCEECHNAFDKPQKYEEPHPYGDGIAYETFFVCPKCKSDNINKASRCSVCQDYIGEFDGICSDCKEASSIRIREFLSSLTEPEKDLLINILEE